MLVGNGPVADAETGVELVVFVSLLFVAVLVFASDVDIFGFEAPEVELFALAPLPGCFVE